MPSPSRERKLLHLRSLPLLLAPAHVPTQHDPLFQLPYSDVLASRASMTLEGLPLLRVANPYRP